VVGRFFRAQNTLPLNGASGLNPHVVGRFFRVAGTAEVLEQMARLNPHVVGRFFRERRDVFFIKFKCLKWSISRLQIFTKINGD
jgi:hypothetical protein